MILVKNHLKSQPNFVILELLKIKDKILKKKKMKLKK